MKLGLELIARRPITLRLGTFFETWIATASGSVRRSLGRDEYHLGLSIGSGGRLAATGRTHICQADLEVLGLGCNGARPALLSDADLTEDGPLIWGIRTNRFLDLAALKEQTGARLLCTEREPREFSLEHPLLVAEAVAPGRYIVDVSGMIQVTRG